MHQFLVTCDVEEDVCVRMSYNSVTLKKRLGQKCQVCFVTTPSVSQEEVRVILRVLFCLWRTVSVSEVWISIENRIQDTGDLRGATSVGVLVGVGQDGQ